VKIRVIKLRPEFFIKMLRGKTNSYASNLPNDTELLAIKYDLFSNQICAIIRSNSFKDIAESHPIEELNVAYTPEFDVVYTPGSREPSPNTKPETRFVPRGSAMIRPKPEEEIQTGPSADTINTEAEFTPEQRKLLDFSVKGENVTVKPIRFLKDEWGDINDTVRSLGGRWVKGETESYWLIPIRQG
jgi:hypothetical protein